MEQYKSLLIGGAGFIGQGLMNELGRRGYRDCEIIDKSDMDLSDFSCIPVLAERMKGFTHIFMLASNLGADLFETDARRAGAQNRRIYSNFAAALPMDAGIRVFYYSTSEIYWSMRDKNTMPGNILPGETIDRQNPRSIYALAKLYVEKNLESRMKFFGGDFTAVNVIRPFNVFGPGQKRGVMYSMIKSALSEGLIRYRDDTTRTFTELSYISRATVDLMDTAGFRVFDMSNGFSTDLRTLAVAVAKFLKRKFKLSSDIRLEAMPQDMSIKYRQASEIITDSDYISAQLDMSQDMHALAVEVSEELRR